MTIQRYSVEFLNLRYRHKVVQLLRDVKLGYVSCGDAATAIMKQVPKRRLTERGRERVRAMRRCGRQVQEIAKRYSIHPSTVWRICKDKG